MSSFIDGFGDRVQIGDQASFSKTVELSTNLTETTVTVEDQVVVERASAKIASTSAQDPDGIHDINLGTGNENQLGVTMTSTSTGSLDVRVDTRGR